jgi:hypothetical protein
MLPRLTVWCSTDELRTHKYKTDKKFLSPLYLLSYPATASVPRVGIEPTTCGLTIQNFKKSIAVSVFNGSANRIRTDILASGYYFTKLVDGTI